jgi:hypothetical protein
MFYEMRTYDVAPGRQADMLARAKDDLLPLLAKHGIEVTGCWFVVAGARTPRFVYLVRWGADVDRQRCWGNFYVDPAWHEARERTNAGSELVEGAISEMLKPQDIVGDLGAVFSLFEWKTHRIAPNQAEPARIALREAHDLAVAEAGGIVLATFDVVFGTDLPRVDQLIGWPGYDERHSAELQLVHGAWSRRLRGPIRESSSFLMDSFGMSVARL